MKKDFGYRVHKELGKKCIETEYDYVNGILVISKDSLPSTFDKELSLDVRKVMGKLDEYFKENIPEKDTAWTDEKEAKDLIKLAAKSTAKAVKKYVFLVRENDIPNKSFHKYVLNKTIKGLDKMLEKLEDKKHTADTSPKHEEEEEDSGIEL